MDPRADELLRLPLVGQLGFMGLDGYPHVLPIWFRWDGTEALIASPPDTYKCRSLRADPRASMAVSTPEHPYRLVTMTGDVTVEVLPEPRRIELVTGVAVHYLGEELGSRYVEQWIRGGHPGDGNLLRLRPRRVRYTPVSGE